MRPFLNKYGIVLGALTISAMASAAYACMIVGPHSWHSFCRQITWIGIPGIMFTAVLTIALQIGSPLGQVLLVATPVNFFLYLGLGLVLRKLVRAFGK